MEHQPDITTINKRFDIRVNLPARDQTSQDFRMCVMFTISPSNAEATVIQSTLTQRFLKNDETLSCWYSLDSSHRVLSYEYP